ncbi:hypothetical protein ACSFB8_07900 [Enterococcus faecalis]
MIQIGLFLSVVVVAFVSYYLLKKYEIFLLLLKEEEKNEAPIFFQQFGKMYALLTIVGLLVSIFNRPFYSIIYLFLLLILSCVFSISLAKKMQ